MAKSLIDMLGLRAFVKSIQRKPSQSLGGGSSLEYMIKALQRETGNPMLEPMLRQVLTTDAEGRVVGIDYDKAKKCAFQCGGMLGFLAGALIKEEGINKAIDAVTQYATRVAMSTHKLLVGKKLIKPQASTTPPTQLHDMIKTLEQQAEAETNPATAAALRAMARNMRQDAKKQVA